MIDWTDAFENGAYIEGAAELREKWQADAAAFRAAWTDKALGVAYGDADRQKYDIFHADNPRGTVVFVHGGYWHQTDRSWWSHLAAGPLAHGWSVAVPSYTLAPAARISEITAEIARAVCAVAETAPRPIRLTGHSAGGHLVSRMAVAGVLPEEVRSRVEITVSISGVHHLVPLREAKMNEILQLDVDEAVSESPALLDPANDARMVFWVGAAERPEFLRQNRMIAEAWSRKGADVAEHYAPGENHFSVVSRLAEADSQLTNALTAEI